MSASAAKPRSTKNGRNNPTAVQATTSGSMMQEAADGGDFLGLGGNRGNSNGGGGLRASHLTAPCGVVGTLGFPSMQPGRDHDQQLAWTGSFFASGPQAQDLGGVLGGGSLLAGQAS